jgi:uncharacterized MnhB-related membrane protein
MMVLPYGILTLVAICATAVVLTRDPRQQIIGMGAYGLILAALFFSLQAPDVALSQIVIGAVALPLMVLLTLAKIRRDHEEHESSRDENEQENQL